jgi:ABC-type multidrug transport system ATPase subunit
MSSEQATNGFDREPKPEYRTIVPSSNVGSPEPDLELNRAATTHLVNDVVHHFSWKHLNVTVKDRNTKKALSILTDAHGIVHAGEMLAIMGPSGSGKTTLLNAIAHREAAAGATTTGDILANGQKMSWQKIRQLSSYVEQEDALIGSLTVRETMKFAAGLALSRYSSSRLRVRKSILT